MGIICGEAPVHRMFAIITLVRPEADVIFEGVYRGCVIGKTLLCQDGKFNFVVLGKMAHRKDAKFQPSGPTRIFSQNACLGVW